MIRYLKILLYVFITWFITTCTSSDDWQGTIEERDGYKIIKNKGPGLYHGKRQERLEILQSVGASGPDERHADLFARISWIEFDDSNNVYVLDNFDQVITKLSSDLTPILQFARKGHGPGELEGAISFAWANNHLYVANSDNGRIEVFDDQGNYIESVHLPEVTHPVKIHYKSGHFYVGERITTSQNYMLRQYDQQWQLTGKLLKVEGINHPYDMIRNLTKTRICPDGFWVIYGHDNKIQKMDDTGTIIFETSREHDLQQPRDSQGNSMPEYPIHRACDADPQGNLYVIYSNPNDLKQGNEVYKYGIDGRLHGKMFTMPMHRADVIRFDKNGYFYFSDGTTLYKAAIMVN